MVKNMMINPKITVIIQARMNSTRFPGKALKKINEKPMLSYVINQVSASKFVDDIIICTTTSSNDSPIVKFCKNNSIKYFQGSDEDVLDRFYQTAKKFHCDPIVRISSDCPLVDPDVIDEIISKFLSDSYDYVSNNIEKKSDTWINSLCNFPQGMVVEICSFKSLKKTWLEAKSLTEREHVFPYIQFNSKKFKISTIHYKKNLSYIRCTVDYIQDLDFLNKLIQKLPNDKKIIKIPDIESTIKKYPYLTKINDFIEFDEGFKKSLSNELKRKTS
jgi:spore coat polysaccharide biosynthesis protein SpsF